MLVDEGRVLVDEGRVLVDEGRVLVDEGRVLVDEGRVLVDRGRGCGDDEGQGGRLAVGQLWEEGTIRGRGKATCGHILSFTPQRLVF